MKFFFIFLFVALFGATKGYRRLSPQENQQLQAVCGTKPAYLTQNSAVPPSHRRSIYNGIPITGEHAPWSIRLQTGLGSCTGTLISPRHVLSASHCVIGDNTKFSPYLNYGASRRCENNDLVYDLKNQMFGVYNSNGYLLSQNVTKMMFLNYCVDLNWRYDDIMILELGNDVVYNEITHPACISKNDYGAIDSDVLITGFGHANWDENDRTGSQLRWGHMTIRGFLKDYREMYLVGKTQAARPGDSGGGAFNISNQRIFILGVCSSIIPSSLDSFFTSVAYHYNQICLYTGVC